MPEDGRMQKMYKVQFNKIGCSYTRSFNTREERDRFADEMRKAGYSVTVWEA